VVGAILTAVSQAAMGLTEDSVMSDQAFALVQLDSIEQRMRESLAKRASAQYEIIGMLNK
jgi:protein-arginine kinase